MLIVQFLTMERTSKSFSCGHYTMVRGIMQEENGKNKLFRQFLLIVTGLLDYKNAILLQKTEQDKFGGVIHGIS